MATSNKTMSVKCVCPFWKDSEGQHILCEGIVGEHTKTVFKSKSDRMRHELRYCCSLKGRYDCMVSKTLEEKYKSAP